MFGFTIQAATREQAIAQAQALIEFLGGNAGALVEEGEDVVTAKGKPGRPKKGAEQALSAAPVTEPSSVANPFGMAASTAPARVYTQQEMVKALTEVAAKRTGDTGVNDGYARVGALIAKVQPGCQNVSQVKPENYAAVIAESGVSV